MPMPWIKQDSDPSSLRAKHRGWAQHLRVVGAGIHPIFQQGVTWALRVTPPRRAGGNSEEKPLAREVGELPQLCPELR